MSEKKVTYGKPEIQDFEFATVAVVQGDGTLVPPDPACEVGADPTN